MTGEPRHDPGKVAAFVTSGMMQDPIPVDNIGPFLTPESLPAWGDFQFARIYLHEKFHRPILHPRVVIRGDVAYAFITNGGSAFAPPDPLAAAIVNMVWRPEFDSWQVHAIGGMLRVDQFPRATTDAG